MCSGNEFQIIGAAKENELLPLADFMLVRYHKQFLNSLGAL